MAAWCEALWAKHLLWDLLYCAFQLMWSLYSHRSTMLLAKCLIFQLKLESNCNVPFFLTFWLTVGGVVNLKLTSPRLYVPIQSTELLFSIPFLVSQHTAMETTKHDRRKITFFFITQFPLRPCVCFSLSSCLILTHRREPVNK